MDVCDRTDLPSPNLHSMVEVTFHNKAAWDTWTLGNAASDSKILSKVWEAIGAIFLKDNIIVANRKMTECGVHDK